MGRVMRCAALLLLAGSGVVAIRPEKLSLASRATLADEAAAAGNARNLLLFGLTQRDKAAHDEHRDAMIEARPRSAQRGLSRALPAWSAPLASRVAAVHAPCVPVALCGGRWARGTPTLVAHARPLSPLTRPRASRRSSTNW